MNAEVEILLQPYDAADGRSILHRLIQEFQSGEWTHFRGAIHFAKQSGNFPALIESMRRFLDADSLLDLTIGADVFGRTSFATDHAAIAELLGHFEERPNFRLHLYHEKRRTFHPKLYMFSNDRAALVIIGSSNWSEGGLFNNVEANAVVRLDLTRDEQRECLERLTRCFEDHWMEPGE